MLVTQTVTVTIRNKSQHYLDKGYAAKYGETLEVKVDDLPASSHARVTASCACGNETELSYHKYLINVERAGYYGCRTCSKSKRRATCVQKFGTDSYSHTEEYKQFMRENTSLKNPETKEKIRKTMVERYGVEHAMQSKEIMAKSTESLLLKYGADHYNRSKLAASKTDERWVSRTVKKMQKAEITYVRIDVPTRKVIFLCSKCHLEYAISIKLMYQRNTLYSVEPCTHCNPMYTGVSGTETIIADYIASIYNKTILSSDKTALGRKELDIYLPDAHLAFEYNGLYWHNEIHKKDSYHLDKTTLAESKGIKLIHIYEDDWLYKQEIIKSRIGNLLGTNTTKIYARKTSLQEVPVAEYRSFLVANHLQGYVSASNRYGLYYKGDLVSVMSFGKVRRALGKKGNGMELLRFCNKLHTSVTGAASKLLKHFISAVKPEHLLTYADRSWSSGNLYDKLGFTYTGNTPPGYAYVNRDVRENRWNYRKDVLVKQGYDSRLTEHEIMLSRGLYRIYDSGNRRYEITIDEKLTGA